MKRMLIVSALLLLPLYATAQQTTSPPCPVGTVTCNNSVETMGDTSQTASANNDQSQNTQAGNKSNSLSNASGVTINPQVQQSGNAVTQSGNSVQGGAASSNGGSSHADGNLMGNMTTGPSTSSANNGGMTGLGGNATTGASNSGGNIVGPSTATVGPIVSTSAGGAGGAGGSSTAQGSKQGQGQGQSSENINKISSSNALTGGAQSNVGGAQTLKGGNTKIGDVGSTSDAIGYSGGNSTNSSADNSGGNSATNVDASNHSNYKSQLTVLPIQPSVPMSISPASDIAVMSDPQCGPYQRVIQTPVYGLFFGITHTSRKVIDHDDTLADPTPEAMNSIWGGRAIYTVSTVNLAGARSISIGGGGSSGGWGQGNTGTTSSMTAQVTHIQMRVCRMVVEQRPVIIMATPAPVVERKPALRIPKHRKPTKACPKY